MTAPDAPDAPDAEAGSAEVSEDELLDWLGAERTAERGRSTRVGASGRHAEDYGVGRYPAHSAAANQVRARSTGVSSRLDEAGADEDGADEDAADGDATDDPYAEFLVEDSDVRRSRRGYGRVPRRGGLMRRVVLSFGSLVLVGLALSSVGAWWLFRQIDPPGPPGEAIVVAIPSGSTGSDIAQLLNAEGVVANETVFRNYIRLRGQDSAGRFLAGAYSVNLNSSMSEVLAALESGPIPIPTVMVTIPEGLRVEEMIAKVVEQVPWFTEAGIRDAVTRPFGPSALFAAGAPSYEGMLFPDTYEVAEGTTEAEFIDRMAAQMELVATQEGLPAFGQTFGYTPYQLVVIASLIEREARVEVDRPKIARVIYNRLATDTRLDIDATVLYALGRTGGGLTNEDLDVDSPYNTRKYKGIPPTPIAAPGRAALQAAVRPEEGKWLYYVLADADGTHYFTEDFRDFQRAVQEARAKGLI